MEHISIIHSLQPNKCDLPYASLEDIKLTGILPANVLGVMQYIPTEADMQTRQSVFKYLLEYGTAELEALCVQLHELGELYKAYDSAEDGATKKYVFAAILYRQYLFYKSSSEINIDAGFFENFKLHFTDLYDVTLFDEAKSVYNTLTRNTGVEIKESNLVFKKAEGRGYISDILRCAGEMGIELNDHSFTSKEFGADIAASLETLFTDKWKELSLYYDKYKATLDRGILDYADQLDFYIYNTKLALEYTDHGIPLCYAHCGEDISIAQGYDITLMAKQCYDIIPNDISFSVSEPVYFLAGANGGGKTTYLRTVGVCVIMSLCGCPVPARRSRVCRLHSLLTHFPRDERFELDGRFLDEQRRVDYILSAMGERSLILLNETYATTNEEKASEMTCLLADKLKNEGQFAVYVTHQKKAQETDIPLLTCVVDEADSGRRTYKIRPLSKSVGSYAEDILKKYSLSRADLEERFGI